ncbi:MAG: hypothetical protein ACYC46_00135 [Acidobacteriaceae bacterium]
MLSTTLQSRAKYPTHEELLFLSTYQNADEHVISLYLGNQMGIGAHVQEEMRNRGYADLEQDPKVQSQIKAIMRKVDQWPASNYQSKAIFASLGGDAWLEFDFPMNVNPSVHIGKTFTLEPLVNMTSLCKPYLMLAVENGKGRAFSACGTAIEELESAFTSEDVSFAVDDSRVGWSHKMEGNEREHKKEYLAYLASRTNDIMQQKNYAFLVVGCREELWNVVEPMLASSLENEKVAGRFLFRSFEESPAELWTEAQSAVSNYRRGVWQEFQQRIEGRDGIVAIGLEEVMQCLHEGRVQTLLLGAVNQESIFLCRDCSHWQWDNQPCNFCHGTALDRMIAVEWLIRKAMLTGTDIVVAPEGAPVAPVAAILRY